MTTSPRPTRLPRDRKHMVRWLSPGSLFVTAVDIVVSGVFGRYSDKRELEGGRPRQAPEVIEGDSAWIDYIADVGDGWDSTYTMAWLLAQKRVAIEPPYENLPNEAGDVLIMGGDEVYPRASEDLYRRRLFSPYEAAAQALTTKERVLFAIPGNHDWYDGLTSFLRTFCENPMFSKWRTPQKRSYFSVKLPHDWWVLGIDIAFDYYVDQAQLAYFRDLNCKKKRHFPFQTCKGIHEGDRIILCTAKPGWEAARLSGDFRSKKQTFGQRALYEFEQEITRPVSEDGWGCRLKLVLSGDLHHYAHYKPANADRPERITAGGGGAFFYPTHSASEDVPWPSKKEFGRQESLKLHGVFPSKRTSRWWQLAIIPSPIFSNPSFAFFVGFIYLLFALVVPGGITEPKVGLKDLFTPPSARPFFVIMAVLLYLALRGFADARTKWGPWVLAVPHWLVHMLALSAAVTFAHDRVYDLFCQNSCGHLRTNVAFALAVGGAVYVLGGLAGGLVMGIYLFLLQLVGRHPNEAYAALHLTNYKNFLRMHIDEQGTLTVYPLGVRSICKRWRPEPMKPNESAFAPVNCPRVEMIDEPIVLGP